jgi:hypothetical protein
MMNLIPHHRIHIPNGLAMFAALILLVSSVIGFEANQDSHSAGQETMMSAKINSAKNDGIIDSAEQKPRGLNLGLLLFRRG